MDINQKINILSQELQTNIENSQLPIGVVYYMIKDLYRDIEQTYFSYLNNLVFQSQKEDDTSIGQE